MCLEAIRDSRSRVWLSRVRLGVVQPRLRWVAVAEFDIRGRIVVFELVCRLGLISGRCNGKLVLLACQLYAAIWEWKETHIDVRFDLDSNLDRTPRGHAVHLSALDLQLILKRKRANAKGSTHLGGPPVFGI